MIEKISDVTGLHGQSTLLDIFCGTGSIGLCLASRVGQVIGVDIMRHAVIDARLNAAKNNVKNAEFIVGPAEDKIQDMINKAIHEDIIAVLDPPTPELATKAVLVIRNSPQIKKVMFLSSDSRTSMNNLVELTRPESATLEGDPFMPISITPVDIFPHTNHTTTLFLFMRVSMYEMVNPRRANMKKFYDPVNTDSSPEKIGQPQTSLDNRSYTMEPGDTESPIPGTSVEGLVTPRGSRPISRSSSFATPNKSNPMTESPIPGTSVEGLMTPRGSRPISRSSSYCSSFATPKKSIPMVSVSRSKSTERPVAVLSPRLIRTQSKRIVPGRTLASYLKNKDPKAFAQYCLELEDHALPEKGAAKLGCRRRRHGTTFPNDEEIEEGVPAYSQAKWKAYGNRATTIVNKVKELVLGANCAEAVVDLIPNFSSEAKAVKRITFISDNYFPTASKHSQKQIVEILPPVVRAASLVLPENVRQAAGPPPSEDTGSLDRVFSEVPCDICKRVYGTPEDNEFQDFLMGCQADRLCSSSKMYHLGCYIPMARVVYNYENYEEIRELRKVIFCSTRCRLIVKKQNLTDSEGLQMGKGRRKKKEKNLEAEDDEPEQ